MKYYRRTVALIGLIGLFMCACTPEHVEPASGQNELQAFGSNPYHSRHEAWCGSVSTYPIVDNAGLPADSLNRTYGNLKVANGSDTIFLMLELGPGWFVDKASWYAGDSAQVPLSQNGLIEPELLPRGADPQVLQNKWMFAEPVTNAGNCYEVVYWCEIIRLSFFGGPLESTRTSAWAKSSPMLNAYSIQYCYTPCSLPGHTLANN